MCMSVKGFTVAEHLIVCELSIFGKEYTKFKVDRTLQNNSQTLNKLKFFLMATCIKSDTI